MSTASALVSSSVETCIFCKKEHSGRCRRLTEFPISERQKLIKQAGRCFICLKGNHLVRDCSKSCSNCGGKHNVVCCYKLESNSVHGNCKDTFNDNKDSKKDSEIRPVQNSCSLISNTLRNSCEPSKRLALFPTAEIVVRGNTGNFTATLLFDSGSDRSYISRRLVKSARLNHISSEKIKFAVFGGRTSCEDKDVFEICVRNNSYSDNNEYKLRVVEVPMICSQVKRFEVPNSLLEGLGDIQLADPKFKKDLFTVDLLIGQDYYWDLMKTEIKRISDSLVIQDSVFGWVLSGSISSKGPVASEALQMLSMSDLSDDQVRKFWDLESIGITPESKDPLVDDVVLKEFNSNIKLVEVDTR